MSTELSTVAVGQFLASSLIPMLDAQGNLDAVIGRLGRMKAEGNDLGVAMLELTQIAVRSSAGHEPPLVQRDLSQADVLRYWSATPMLIAMLVAPQPPEAIEAVTDQLSGYAEANVQGTGPMYREALSMVREAQILGRAAAEVNRQFGI